MFKNFVNISLSLSHYRGCDLKKIIITLLIVSVNGRPISINRIANAQKTPGHGERDSLQFVLGMKPNFKVLST